MNRAVCVQRWAVRKKVPQISNPQICGLMIVRLADLPPIWKFVYLQFADPLLLYLRIWRFMDPDSFFLFADLNFRKTAKTMFSSDIFALKKLILKKITFETVLKRFFGGTL
jgi:hypothetical protein